MQQPSPTTSTAPQPSRACCCLRAVPAAYRWSAPAGPWTRVVSQIIAACWRRCRAPGCCEPDPARAGCDAVWRLRSAQAGRRTGKAGQACQGTHQCCPVGLSPALMARAPRSFPLQQPAASPQKEHVGLWSHWVPCTSCLQVTRCVPVVTSGFIACLQTIQALKAWPDPEEGGGSSSSGSADSEDAQPEGPVVAAARAEELAAGRCSVGGSLCEEQWQVLARCMRFLALRDLHQALASMTQPQEWRIPAGGCPAGARRAAPPRDRLAALGCMHALAGASTQVFLRHGAQATLHLGTQVSIPRARVLG